LKILENRSQMFGDDEMFGDDKIEQFPDSCKLKRTHVYEKRSLRATCTEGKRPAKETYKRFQYSNSQGIEQMSLYFIVSFNPVAILEPKLPKPQTSQTQHFEPYT